MLRGMRDLGAEKAEREVLQEGAGRAILPLTQGEALHNFLGIDVEMDLIQTLHPLIHKLILFNNWFN